jgi:hypothetical protein
MSNGDSILADDGKWYTIKERPDLFKEFDATKKRLEAVRHEPDDACVPQSDSMFQQPELQSSGNSTSQKSVHQLLVPEEVQSAFKLEEH